MHSRTKSRSCSFTSVRDYSTRLSLASKLTEAIAHCFDTLRQVLMCNVDTGVLGQVWYDKESSRPFPDFNTQHTCKNYDAVRAWAQEHQVRTMITYS